MDTKFCSSSSFTFTYDHARLRGGKGAESGSMDEDLRRDLDFLSLPVPVPT